MGKTEDAPGEESANSDKQEDPKDQSKENNSEDPVEDVESLRTVIKLDEKEEESDVGEEKKEKKKEENNDDQIDLDGVGDLVEESEETGSTASASTREALEQKRALLQRIKDFDLQIKKNQQDITDISEKMNAISKDLDDLVSLYEIVSEQMNPFVGLSKVTKKRLESFETIHKEIGSLKEKISIIEAGGNFDFSKIDESKELNDEESIESEDESLKPDVETVSDENEQPILPDESLPEESQIEIEPGIDSFYDFDLTDDEINQIIELSFSKFPSDNQLDQIIDEYIESLKAG